jgi:hypothetical protein
MNCSKSTKIFCLLLLATIMFSACSFWQTAENNQNNSNTFVPDELKSEIPFATKEPEIFQADLVIETFSNGEKTERKTSVARNSEKLRYDYPSKISFLQISENERFLIDNEKKIYAKSQTNFDEKEKTEETLKDFLTTKWLNEKHDAKFENLGTENGLTKYRVISDGAADSNSETIIYFDEQLKIPVKQEFSLVKGEQKTKVYSMEIRELKFKVDEDRFKLPEKYKQVSIKEYQEAIRR